MKTPLSIYPPTSHILLHIVIIALCLAAGITQAQTTAFTYQGHLMDNGASANGNYDIQFTIKTTLAGGQRNSLSPPSSIQIDLP